MALYLVHRPAWRTDLKNTAGLHGALVDAADATAAIAAANALCPDLNSPFAGYAAVLVAPAAQDGFTPALVEGDVVGAAYSGPRRGR